MMSNDRLTAEGPNTYTYDANGSTLTKTDGISTTTYAYNHENRLESAVTPDGHLSYAYDMDSIRILSEINGAVTRYLVDPNRPYAQVLEEADGNGNVLAFYAHGDDLISQSRDGETSYYHYDGHGSTVALTDPDETVTDTYLYEAFGGLIANTGDHLNLYLYTGEQYDPNLNLYYLRARYYNPTYARFHSMDSWMGRTQDPITLHKYLYADANPVMNLDPSGNSTLSQTIVVTGIILDAAFIVYGGYEIYQGNYVSGVVNIGLGFLGIGVIGSGVKFVKFVGGPLNRLIRLKYITSLRSLAGTVEKLRKIGTSSEKIAQHVVELRNLAKAEARAQMIAEGGIIGNSLVKLIELRNLKKYGDKLGPTVEWFISRGKTWEEIIESALRSNERINGFFGVL